MVHGYILERIVYWQNFKEAVGNICVLPASSNIPRTDHSKVSKVHVHECVMLVPMVRYWR